MLARSAEALFANLIDYAGLFPPASLPMADAVRNYEAYRRGEHAWMLGRFVVPAERIEEALAASASLATMKGEALPGSSSSAPLPHPAPSPTFGMLSVLGDADNDVIEVKQPVEPKGRTVYVEASDLDAIDDLAAHGLRAKIRTGGITPAAFPTAAHVANFIRRCAERGAAFKATAGLHHPLRCVKPLTYEPDAPTGVMHGFVNVFLAAALGAHMEEILMEDDPHAFSFDDEAAAWRGHAVRTEELARVRREFAISFGSCSFEEPIADLKELGWL
jgi:hypothetical protein